MAVLITGGAGYIGSHVAWALHDLGEAFVVLDNFSTGNIASLPRGSTVFKGDIDDADVCNEIFSRHEIETVIHMAAKIIVPESVVKPFLYYDENFSKAIRFFYRAASSGVSRFVLSSTAAVYGNHHGLVSEDAATVPSSPYGQSKRMLELALQDFESAYNIKFVVLRYFNVAGADDLGRTGQLNPAATHLIKVACEASLGKRPLLQVFGSDYPTSDGTCIRDYIHVSDLADIHCVALNWLRDGQNSSIFNCGYGTGFSVAEVIKAVKRISGIDFKVEISGRRLGDPATLIADNAKLVNLTQWRPKRNSLDHIVGSAHEWEKRLVSR